MIKLLLFVVVIILLFVLIRIIIRINNKNENNSEINSVNAEMLDEYEKENNELQFFKEEDKNDNPKDIKDKDLIDNLKPIDKFSLNYYKDEYTYRQFVKEKEAKMNLSYNLYNSDNESQVNEDESIDLGNESESDNDSINKMDIDRAYDLYLKKKNEIMKMFEAEQQEKEEKEEKEKESS